MVSFFYSPSLLNVTMYTDVGPHSMSNTWTTHTLLFDGIGWTLGDLGLLSLLIPAGFLTLVLMQCFCSLQFKLCLHHTALLRRYSHPGSSLQVTRFFSSHRYQSATNLPTSIHDGVAVLVKCDGFVPLGKVSAEGCYGRHLLGSLWAYLWPSGSSTLCQSPERGGRWGLWLKGLVASAGLSSFDYICNTGL